ncbi:hypothetical protein CDAR_602611 [Caerostris darwini]|uniref:Endonuclease/exonuclease/phosphatase domain-containing protein n=1 Tax=Caerostris darwini TaxID=1538125 RepID=A0AAV4V5K9_9ARAC|nr:hypothetical protein CDAR_602611 [Caerostris darwini]
METLIIGDFNSHSTRWGYRDVNPQGRIMDHFLDSSAETLIEESGHTFLSFKSSTSRLSRSKLKDPGHPSEWITQEDDHLFNDDFNYYELLKALREIEGSKSAE